MKFLFDGRILCDEDTAVSLELEDDDVIEAYSCETEVCFITFEITLKTSQIYLLIVMC